MGMRNIFIIVLFLHTTSSSLIQKVLNEHGSICVMWVGRTLGIANSIFGFCTLRPFSLRVGFQKRWNLFGEGSIRYFCSHFCKRKNFEFSLLSDKAQKNVADAFSISKLFEKTWTCIILNSLDQSKPITTQSLEGLNNINGYGPISADGHNAD